MENKKLAERIPASSPGGRRKSCPQIMGSASEGNWVLFWLSRGRISEWESGLEGPLSGKEGGERTASSMSGGVPANDDASEEGDWKRGR